METTATALEAIEKAALQKGVSMTSLCRAAGIDYSTYWRWKKNKGGATILKIMQLQKALETAK